MGILRRRGRVNRAKAAVAGLVGAAAFWAEMQADKPLLRSNYDDTRLLAGWFTPHWVWVGLGIHLINGATLGVAYAAARPYLPGPNWLRGLLFAQGENAVLYPMGILFDRWHPDIREGRMPGLLTPGAIAQGLVRHAAYGLALGGLYGDGD